MNIDDVKTICTVGAGNMGHQIAILAAISGYESFCTDIDGQRLEQARAFAEKYLPERVAKGKMAQETADAALKRLHFTTSLEEAARTADFVIEAATEKLQLKRELFSQLDRICPPHAILTTNSSFIVSSLVIEAVKRPDKVCNMHFFNPALVMKVVEVVKGDHTSNETIDITMELCRRMSKTPVFINKEIYGFVVNRILDAINREALFLANEGIASIEDIDIAVVGALNHPMGPFRLMDLTGIDLSYYVKQERFAETGDPADAPSPIVVEKFKAGEYGRKTGKGFYKY